METILLTKEDCPVCERLKKTLNSNPRTKKGLENITRVHETDNPEEYEKLTTEYGILSMPSMIHNGEVVPLARIPQIVSQLS